MGLPPVSALFEPVTCFPAWHTVYKKYGGRLSGVVKSGCSTSGGNVQCRPEDMARAAGAKIGTPVSLEVYTLARYLASEVGSGTVEEKVAVAQAAVNRAVYVERLPHGILSLLLYRQKPGHPNYGYYGPIHAFAADGSHTSPYGRWAATSKDPTVGDLILALALVDGVFDGFNKGADDQNGPNGLSDPIGKIYSQAKNHDYWVGPLPGVNPWHTFLYRHLPEIPPSSPQGQFLIQRAVAAMKTGKPSWLMTPVCGTNPLRAKLMPAVAGFTGVGLLGFLLVGILGRRRRLLGGRDSDWWKHHASERDRGRLCYKTKTAALQVFRDANRPTIDAWGGLDVSASPAEFDALNHKYSLTGKRAVRSLARALWVATPNKPPYCLDRIDLEALNQTSPGQHGRGFVLPPWAYTQRTDDAERAHYEAEEAKAKESRLRRMFDRAFDKALMRRGVQPVDEEAAPF